MRPHLRDNPIAPCTWATWANPRPGPGRAHRPDGPAGASRALFRPGRRRHRRPGGRADQGLSEHGPPARPGGPVTPAGPGNDGDSSRAAPASRPRHLTRGDRQYSLGRLASIAGLAAAAAVAARQPWRGVELLEQTRGILAADTLDARGSDLARLRARAPGLAQASSKTSAPASTPSPAQPRHSPRIPPVTARTLPGPARTPLRPAEDLSPHPGGRRLRGLPSPPGPGAVGGPGTAGPGHLPVRHPVPLRRRDPHRRTRH